MRIGRRAGCRDDQLPRLRLQHTNPSLVIGILTADLQIGYSLGEAPCRTPKPGVIAQ